MSIVLLTYNCAHRLDRVLDEVIAAGVPVVAVDNASSDGTADVLEGRDELTVVRLPHNLGAAGRTVGVDHVTTPYVAFCDDDGWYEQAGLIRACDLMDAHPRLDLVNARILVGTDETLDPISDEMAQSPLPDREGVPGAVLLSFMGGASIMRVSAFRRAGGYDARFFMGGEEETLSFVMLKQGSLMRYVDDVVVHHEPSLANAGGLRAHGMRNSLWTAWLHRRLPDALRWTLFVLVDNPKNADYVRAVLMTLRGLPWVLRERQPFDRRLGADLRVLDRRRFATRRPFFTRRGWTPDSPTPTET